MSPLRHPVFRALWIASAVSAIGTWMQDLGAVWLMTSLSPSPLLVALIQTAGSLPFFMLALPAGAIADVVDRRRMLLFTQGWMLVAATLLGVFTLAGITTPWVLLVFTFALSLGSAMNMPVWQAIIPELVAKDELPSAVALSGIVINLARAIGPALAGIILATAGGPGAVFLVNAVTFVGVIVVIYRWRRIPKPSGLPAERVWGAIQAGIRFTRFWKPLQIVLVRTGTYIFCGSALFALLPILGRQELGLDAVGYGIILGFWGLGGLLGAFILPKAQKRLSVDTLVAIATFLYATMTLTLAYLRNYYLVCGVMIFVGIGSLTLMASFNVAAQTVVPGWVRARALAFQLLVFQGSMAAGSFVWGAIAQRAGLSIALTGASMGLLVGLVIALRFPLNCGKNLDLAPSLHWRQQTLVFEPYPDDGPVLIQLEYHVDPQQADEFVEAMQPIGVMRRRDGAIQWGLFHDLTQCGRFVESFIVESWVEHKRQFERVTNSDRILQDRARSFHISDQPPKVFQMIYANRTDERKC